MHMELWQIRDDHQSSSHPPVQVETMTISRMERSSTFLADLVACIYRQPCRPEYQLFSMTLEGALLFSFLQTTRTMHTELALFPDLQDGVLPQ